MSESQENYPKIQQRINPINIGTSLSSSPSTSVDRTEDTTMPHPTPAGNTQDSQTTADPHVKGSMKRQFSKKYLRHVSFSGDVPGEVKPVSRGRMGSISGDLEARSSRVVRRTNVLLLYTGGALGWKLIPGGN
jgi:hypothetical protein